MGFDAGATIEPLDWNFGNIPGGPAALKGASGTIREPSDQVIGNGDTVWSEWHWQGLQSGGTPLDMVGVLVCGVREERISWARLYMEPVEHAGAGIESAVRRMTGGE